MFNQQTHTTAIRSTILFLKTLNSYMIRSLLVHHQGQHCCCINNYWTILNYIVRNGKHKVIFETHTPVNKWIAVSSSVMPCSITLLHYGTASGNATHVPEGFGPQRKHFRKFIFHITFMLVIYVTLEAFWLRKSSKWITKINNLWATNKEIFVAYLRE